MVQAVVAGEPMAAVAARFETDRKAGRKWVVRYRARRPRWLG